MMKTEQSYYLYYVHGQFYGRWLVHVRMALRSIGERSARPCSEHWRALYDDGLTPETAVRLNMGAMSETESKPLGSEVIVPYQYYCSSMISKE